MHLQTCVSVATAPGDIIAEQMLFSRRVDKSVLSAPVNFTAESTLTADTIWSSHPINILVILTAPKTVNTVWVPFMNTKTKNLQNTSVVLLQCRVSLLCQRLPSLTWDTCRKTGGWDSLDNIMPVLIIYRRR